LEVNGNINLDTTAYFDTIVLRRLDGDTTTTGLIIFIELQLWIIGSNILPLNSNTLVGYFANWDNNDIELALATVGTIIRPVSLIYNNIIEADLGPHAPLSGSNALIIKNIPLTAINEVQALVLYNRKNTSDTRVIGLFLKFYNSTNDPDLTTTNVITSRDFRYTYNFPSISTYTGSFASADSTTLIINNSVA
jgi:hypothetical protein